MNTEERITYLLFFYFYNKKEKNMKEKKIYSVIELPLVTEPWQKDALNKKMDCARRVYNSMLSMELKKYKEMIKTKEWRTLNAIIKEELQNSPKKKTDKLKEAYERKNEIMKQNDFTEFNFISQAIVSSKYYQKHISSKMAALSIGSPMWSAFEKLFFGDGERVSFKGFDTPVTIASDNKSGIRFLQEEDGRYYILLSNRIAKAKAVKIYIKGPNTEYDRDMLKANVKLVRVLKKVEKGKDKYYCQLTVDKPPVLKRDAEGNIKHPIGKGEVGIAIWRGKLYAVSDKKVLYVNMAPNLKEFTEKRDSLSRELEHIRRVNNPDNYNPDGTVKKGIVGEDGKRHRLCWIYTNHYKRIKAELKEVYRKQDVAKSLLQNKIVNELLSMGNSFHMADVSFLTNKPEWDEENLLSNQEYKNKKERRKSIQETSPSMLFTKMDMKLSGRGLEKINRYKIPENLYWYRHDNGENDKDFFKTGNISFGKNALDQTLYRAFLIRHYDEIEEKYNQKALIKEWPDFLKLNAM